MLPTCRHRSFHPVSPHLEMFISFNFPTPIGMDFSISSAADCCMANVRFGDLPESDRHIFEAPIVSGRFLQFHEFHSFTDQLLMDWISPSRYPRESFSNSHSKSTDWFFPQPARKDGSFWIILDGMLRLNSRHVQGSIVHFCRGYTSSASCSTRNPQILVAS